MKKPVTPVRDQKEPTLQTSGGRQEKMILIKNESNKAMEKAGRPKRPHATARTNPDPLMLNSPSPNGDLDPRIAERAYELWQHRGGHHGQDLEDWLAAEREVLSGEECYS